MPILQTRDGQPPEPEPAQMTVDDLITLVVDMRCAVARMSGMLASCARRGAR